MNLSIYGLTTDIKGRRVRIINYLPKAEEDNPFDAQELSKRFVWCQLFIKHMVKNDKRIQSQWHWNVQNYCECPAHPTRIYSNKLESDHQDGAHRANNNKLPCPVLEKLQCIMIQTNRMRLHLIDINQYKTQKFHGKTNLSQQLLIFINLGYIYTTIQRKYQVFGYLKGCCHS